MAKRLKAYAFCHELCEWLNRRKRFGPNVHWVPNYRLSATKDYVDVAGLDSKGEPSILIEVELHREDPISNVVKAFKWAHQNNRKNLTLFHIFSNLYGVKKSERRIRAIFLGNIFGKDCHSRYIPVLLKYSPRAGGRFGAGRRTRAARLAARSVMNRAIRLKLIKHK